MKQNTFLLNGLRCMLALAAMIPMQPLSARESATNRPDTTIHTYVKQMPTYRDGGIERFAGWMYEEVQYPQAAIDAGIGGTVNLRFVVEPDGTIGEVRLKAPDEKLSDEVTRVLKCAERWEPGLHRKQPARVELHLTVRFNKKDTTICIQRTPMFLDGDLQTFRKWVHAHVTYPPEMRKQRRSGQVLVSFVVKPDGSLGDIKPIKSSHPDFTQAVMEAVHSAPNWTPGIQNGKFVNVRYVLPINFNSN